jgi:hypothetical protein
MADTQYTPTMMQRTIGIASTHTVGTLLRIHPKYCELDNGVYADRHPATTGRIWQQDSIVFNVTLHYVLRE